MNIKQYDRLRRRGKNGVEVELLLTIGYNLRHYHIQKTGKKEKADK